VEWVLSVLDRWCDALRQPYADGRDLVIGQVLVSGHIGSGDSELGHLRDAIDALFTGI